MTDTLERMTEEKVANGAVVGEAVAEPLVAADGMLKTFPSDPFATPIACSSRKTPSKKGESCLFSPAL